jgi:hypothetical protein
MAIWTTVEIPTRKDFVHRFNREYELIIVEGRHRGLYGSQSLATVLDEYEQVLVSNPKAGWTVLIQRRGNGAVIVPSGKRCSSRSSGGQTEGLRPGEPKVRRPEITGHGKKVGHTEKLPARAAPWMAIARRAL